MFLGSEQGISALVPSGPNQLRLNNRYKTGALGGHRVTLSSPLFFWPGHKPQDGDCLKLKESFDSSARSLLRGAWQCTGEVAGHNATKYSYCTRTQMA